MKVIQPVRVLGCCKTGLASNVSDAVRWAAGGFIQGVPDSATPAQILSMSFSRLCACPSYLQSSIDFARSTGAVLIAAAGNNGVNTTDYFPANCNWVVPPLEKYIGHILQLWASLCGSTWLGHCNPLIGHKHLCSTGGAEQWHKLQRRASLMPPCSADCQGNELPVTPKQLTTLPLWAGPPGCLKGSKCHYAEPAGSVESVHEQHCR